jgi:hypothetical protein
MVCSLPPGDCNLTIAAGTGTVRPQICCLLSAPPQERQVEKYKPVFSGDVRPATGFSRNLWRVTIVYSGGQRKNLYFSKIVAFKGMVRKFLNM